MAYLAFGELGGAAANRALAAASAAAAGEPDHSLGPLEWTVVSCARGDGRGTLAPEGWRQRLARRVFGRPDPRLADPRLEALRRLAVLAWRDGYAVAAPEVRRFFQAGFGPRQLEAVVDRIGAMRALPPRTAGLARAA